MGVIEITKEELMDSIVGRSAAKLCMGEIKTWEEGFFTFFCLPTLIENIDQDKLFQEGKASLGKYSFEIRKLTDGSFRLFLVQKDKEDIDIAILLDEWEVMENAKKKTKEELEEFEKNFVSDVESFFAKKGITLQPAWFCSLFSAKKIFVPFGDPQYKLIFDREKNNIIIYKLYGKKVQEFNKGDKEINRKG